MQRLQVVWSEPPCHAGAWLLSRLVSRRQSAPADGRSGVVDVLLRLQVTQMLVSGLGLVEPDWGGFLSVEATHSPSELPYAMSQESRTSLSSAVSEVRRSLLRALILASRRSLASGLSEARRLLDRSRSVANRLSL